LKKKHVSLQESYEELKTETTGKILCLSCSLVSLLIDYLS
jgi:hypothetical protein